MQARVVVAEVTTSSLGIGYELGWTAERLSRSCAGGIHFQEVLCLYRPQEGKMLSAMIRGSPELTVKDYSNLEEACQHIDAFFTSLGLQKK